MPGIWPGGKARGGRISLVDLRPTSNAAAGPKTGNPAGGFPAGVWRRCSSVTGRCGHAPLPVRKHSRLARRPPENRAPAPHLLTGSEPPALPSLSPWGVHPIVKKSRYMAVSVSHMNSCFGQQAVFRGVPHPHLLGVCCPILLFQKAGQLFRNAVHGLDQFIHVAAFAEV